MQPLVALAARRMAPELLGGLHSGIGAVARAAGASEQGQVLGIAGEPGLGKSRLLSTEQVLSAVSHP